MNTECRLRHGAGNTYTVEFRGEQAEELQRAWDDLQGLHGNHITLADGRSMRIDPGSPCWIGVAAAMFQPQHADLETGRWTYVDGQWRSLAITTGPTGACVARCLMSDTEVEDAIANLLAAHRRVLARFDEE